MDYKLLILLLIKMLYDNNNQFYLKDNYENIKN